MVITSKFNLSTIVKLLLFTGFFIFSGLASAATIQVKSDRNPVSLNESFQLVYESSESVDDDPDFSPLEKYLDILNRSQSSSVRIINGSYSSTKTWTLSVIAREVGVIVLPPILFGSDQSSTYQITVKEAVINEQAQSGFYTRIRVDQEQVYAQQQLVITQQIFSDKNLSAYGLGELDFNGMDVISQPLGEEKQYKTRIGDRAFLVIERSYAVFPQQTGLLKLAPVLAEARIGRASNSFFDSFSQSKVVRAQSNPLSIAVLPVPKNINVNPWLPAKDFQLLEQWPQNPPTFIQGEPVTRTLSIKAEGLTAAQLPVLPDISIDGLKQYPDQPLLNDIKNDTGITGYRLEKVALIPMTSGVITLPAIEIPWWNTATQQREIARIPARTIEVQAAAITAQSAMPAAPVAQQPENEVPPKSAQLESVPPQASNETLPESKFWFVLAISFALGWLVTAIVWIVTANKKPRVNADDLASTPLSLKKAFKQLKIACDKEDVSDCRSQLLSWGQTLFSTQNIKNLNDLSQLSAAQMSAEIRHIDAFLYGGEAQQINFSIIVEQAEKMMRDNSKPAGHSDVLLEPLYK